MQPFIELLIWSTLLALVTALIYRFLTKPEEMRRLKKEMNDLRDRANKASKAGDTKEATRLTSEMMKANSLTFKMNMKPMIVSFLAFVVPLYFYFPMTFKDLLVASPFTIPFIGDSLGWLYWYIIVVLAGNFIFRKLLGVE